MSAWLRLLFTLTNSLLRQSRLRPDEESTLTFRVWVTGADVSVMNNAKYLTVMEMGRVDLMLRTGFFKLARAKRWASPLASITVQFRKLLKRFQRFQLRAGLVYWHEKYIYFRHVVEREGQPAAVGIARIAILNRAGRVRPSEALAELGHPVAAPAIPPVIESLQRSEKLMRQW